MLRMSVSTFRERWPVFVGAIGTVCLGVALVQSSLLTLISAATADVPAGLPPAEDRALRDGYAGAISLLGMTLGLASFVTIFVVSSTFAFTVAQRRRDLALLRLTGASRGQVRVLLLGEALLLGTAGSALGVLAGVPLMRVQARMLERLDLVPAGFAAQWRDWIVYVGVGTGVGTAMLGVLAASRRASRVRPLEALRETGEAARVMTTSRWVLGILFLVGSATMLVLVPAVGGEAALSLSIFVSMLLVVAFAALAPLVVPLVSLPFGMLFRGRLGQLAYANLRSGVRRSASTAAPVMVLVAFVAGIAGTMGTMTEASRLELTRDLRADLMLTTDRPVDRELAALTQAPGAPGDQRAPGASGASGDQGALGGERGIAAFSVEVPVPIDLRIDEGDGEHSYEAVDALAVDPAGYVKTHRIRPTAGDLADLRGAAVAVSPSYDPSQRWRLGSRLRVRLDDGAGRGTRVAEPTELRVVALLPDRVSGPYFLLSPDLMPDTGPRRYAVRVAEPSSSSLPTSLAASLARFGEVVTVREWIERQADEQQRNSVNIMVALAGLTMLYTVIAMVNTVVISASDRRGDFATARITGLTRSQVVRAALGESLAVVAIGLSLGALAAASTVIGVTMSISDLIGVTAVSPQWPLLGALVLGAIVIVGGSNVVTTLAITRSPAVRVVATD